MKLSVLLPVYNGSEFLSRAIESILAQDFEDFEFIIIDDASTDETPGIIRRMAEKDSRIRPVFHKENAGVSASLNEGLHIASAPYVVRMDHDDESLPQRLGTQYTFMHSRPNVAAAGSFVFHMGITPAMDRLVRLPVGPEINRVLPKENCIYHPSVIMNRKLVLEAGGYRPQFKHSEDYDLWLRLSRDDALANIPVPLLRYRFTVSGQSLGKKWDQFRYALLAQASFQNPARTWPEIEKIANKLHRSHNKQRFLECVLRGTMKELLALGQCDEARLLMDHFAGDLGNKKISRIANGFLTDSEPGSQVSSSEWLEAFSAPNLDEAARSIALGNQGTNASRSRPVADIQARSSKTPRFGFLWSKSEKWPRELSSALTALGFLVLILPSFYWVARDRHVWPWDPAWYGEVSVDLWFKLTNHFSQWMPSMLHAFGTKSPGIAWFGQFFVPLGAAVGSIETALLLSVLAAQLGSMAMIFRIGKVFAPERRLVSFAGVLVFASAPLFVAMSHQYFVEALQLFAVSYFYFVAAKARGMGRLQLLGNLLLATSIAMLAKASSPAYCFLPGAMAAWFLFARRDINEQKRRRIRPGTWMVTVVGIVLSVGCAAWYIINFKILREFIRQTSSGDVALAYGTKAGFVTKLAYWLHASQASFQLPWVGIGLLILFSTGAILYKRLPAEPVNVPRLRWKTTDVLAAFSLIHIVVVISLFSMSINQENRYLLPLLPAIATVTLWILSKIRQSQIITLAIVLFICQWVTVCGQALRLSPRNPQASYWLHPLDSDVRTRNEVKQLVMRTCAPETAFRMNIVGTEIPWLNANTLSFFAAKEELRIKKRCFYTSLGYAEKDDAKAWERLNSLRIAWFITLDEKALSTTDHSDYFNKVSNSVLQRIRADTGFIQEPFDSKLGVILFRNHAQGIPEKDIPGT